jgi:glycine hydroxymethyltransferase
VGRRYYGGCEHVDVIEQLATDRANRLFGAEFADVEPHAGVDIVSGGTDVHLVLLNLSSLMLVGQPLLEGGHGHCGAPRFIPNG